VRSIKRPLDRGNETYLTDNENLMSTAVSPFPNIEPPPGVENVAKLEGRPPDAVDRLLFRAENRLGYSMVAAFVACMYCGIIGPYLKFSSTVLPIGDPFTYTTGYFLLLDTAQHDFWAGLAMAFNANWYWMFNVPIALLSPILVKEPFSLSMVTFIMFGFATASFFRLGRHFRYPLGVAVLVALLPWVFPINFGFQDYSSIAVLGLDSMFVALLNLCVATLLVFALDPYTWRHAVVAGVAVGLAIWGRGNSIFVVGMVGFVPVLALAYRVWRNRRIPWINVAIFAVISGFMTALFFGKMGGPIAGYYTAHLAFVTRHVWNWHDAMPYLKNVPGFFFWRAENSVLTISLTWVLHVLVAASMYLVWRVSSSGRRNSLSVICATGVFIYFVTYLANIVLFTDPLITLYNALLIYAPMRIGMTLVVFAIVGAFVSANRLTLNRNVTVAAMAVLIVYGVWLTKLQTPQAPPGMPTPRGVEAFAKSIDDLLKGNSISVLWYRHYSPAILRYYLRKNDSDLNLYMDKYYNDIWQAYDYGEEKRMKVRAEIGSHFANAGAIIISEYVDYYSPGYPYSFYKMSDEFPRYLNSPASPKFVVRAILQEYDNQRLLVLQRESLASGQGEPLKLPYGPSSRLHDDYGPKVMRFSP
jgi:hypothetical protein